MKNKEISEGNSAQIHTLSHDGRGIATIQNKTTFIKGALPSETVTYQVTQKHTHYNEAHVLNILNTSSERVTPPCSHFGVCGGCTLQHMSEEKQIELKQQTLLDQLKHFGKVTPATVLPPLQADTLGYRRKARLGVKFVIKKNKVLIGFREKSSRYLADLERCVVLHPAVGERLNELSQLIASLENYQSIAQIEVAIGDVDIALVFRHLENLTEEDKEKLIEFGKKYLIHIYLQPNPPALLHKIWPADGYERLSYTLPHHQLEFIFHPLDFTQIHLELNRSMVKQALSLLELKTTDTVLDLFCGIGNFTLPMAQQAKHVTGIEGSQDMVNRARENAAHNQIQNVDFAMANLIAPIAAPWMHSTYNKILIDPPRVGAKEILPYFTQFAAEKIVYVSCNPATLARDAGELVHQHGYHLSHAGIMNMFPHTAHIEAMAVFEKR